MKDKTIRFLLVANLVAMLLVLGTQMLRPASAEAQAAKAKWEYRIFAGRDITTGTMNTHGDQGWEAISMRDVILSSDGLPGQEVFYKRRKN